VVHPRAAPKTIEAVAGAVVNLPTVFLGVTQLGFERATTVTRATGARVFIVGMNDVAELGEPEHVVGNVILNPLHVKPVRGVVISEDQMQPLVGDERQLNVASKVDLAILGHVSKV
jgi:hypothetical protein